MKGLIIKDYYCMKKTIRMIALVSVITIFLAIMFTLSTKYGNVAKGIAKTAEKMAGNDSMIPEEVFLSVYRYVIWIVLLIPMAYIANVIDCFEEDSRAGFAKVLFSMPVSTKEIVGARYLSVLLYAFVGCVVSLIAAGCVSLASDYLQFIYMVSVIFTFLGSLLFFVAGQMMFLYWLGVKYKEFIFIGEGVAVVIILFPWIKSWWQGVQKIAGVDAMTVILDSFNDFLTTKGIYIFLTAIVAYAISYICSVQIVKKRRGADFEKGKGLV